MGTLSAITRFDLGEFRFIYGRLELAYDILDLGHWYDDPGSDLDAQYERPDPDFRAVRRQAYLSERFTRPDNHRSILANAYIAKLKSAAETTAYLTHAWCCDPRFRSWYADATGQGVFEGAWDFADKVQLLAIWIDETYARGDFSDGVDELVSSVITHVMKYTREFGWWPDREEVIGFTQA